MPTSKDIDAFLARYPEAVRDTAAAARKLLKEHLPDVAEKLDEAARLLGYSYAPGYKGLVCTLMMSQTGVKLGIFRGSELPDPKGLLAGAGKVHRHVQLRSADDTKKAGLSQLLNAALAAWQQRAGAAR
jgi:hypothetical protein